jgi:small-conductance mechanosensitive channel
MGNAFVDSIPNLAFLAVLILVVRYLLEALRLFFLGIASGAVRSSSFEPEWAMMTYRLIRWGIIAFAVVVAYPYIPGSSSDAFKGVSVFTGVLFSLGASSIVSNTLAGYTLIFRRVFKIGDRVLIGKYLGDVTEIRQQVTVLRTLKNEEVIVPNSTILGAEVVNYSTLGRQGKLILHTSVTIGYDTPWRQVEAMLLEAAERTPGLLKEPPPFVLKRALDDFYVSYEINACCDDPSRMPALYSSLHGNIVDAFNTHGVQIMSPHFVGQPEQAVLVPKDRWFDAPARPPGENPGAHPKA